MAGEYKTYTCCTARTSSPYSDLGILIALYWILRSIHWIQSKLLIAQKFPFNTYLLTIVWSLPISKKSKWLMNYHKGKWIRRNYAVSILFEHFVEKGIKTTLQVTDTMLVVYQLCTCSRNLSLCVPEWGTNFAGFARHIWKLFDARHKCFECY